MPFFFRDVSHWRWRHLFISVVATLTSIVFVFLCSQLSRDLDQQLVKAERFQTRHFDAMLLLADGQGLPQRGTMYDFADKAAIGVAHSNVGDLTLLGIPLARHCFNIPENMISGRELAEHGEVVVPHSLASKSGIVLGQTIEAIHNANNKLRCMQLNVVGIYQDDGDFAPCLILDIDARDLFRVWSPNCLLIACTTPDARLVQSMESISAIQRVHYPGATLITENVPYDILVNQFSSFKRPVFWLMIIICLFALISLFTVIFLTFLERRREIAVMKSLGKSHRQLVLSTFLEYSVGEAVGILCCWAFIVIVKQHIPVLAELSMQELARYTITAGIMNFGLCVVAMLFPTLTSLIASVDQLLYARTIPLRTHQIDQLPKRTNGSLGDAGNPDIHILRLPEVLGDIDCLMLRHVGDNVRYGEILAVDELWGGLYRREWRSPCDGQIISLSSGGFLEVKDYSSE